MDFGVIVLLCFVFNSLVFCCILYCCVQLYFVLFPCTFAVFCFSAVLFFLCFVSLFCFIVLYFVVLSCVLLCHVAPRLYTAIYLEEIHLTTIIKVRRKSEPVVFFKLLFIIPNSVFTFADKSFNKR